MSTFIRNVPCPNCGNKTAVIFNTDRLKGTGGTESSLYSSEIGQCQKSTCGIRFIADIAFSEEIKTFPVQAKFKCENHM
jgi:hypothetical protein